MSENLKDLAERAKMQHESMEETENLAEFEQIEDEAVVMGDESEDDGDAVVIDGDFADTDDSSELSEEDLDSGAPSDKFELTEEDLKSTMPDLSDEEFLKASENIKGEVDTYRKKLIIQMGFTIAEANEAALNHAKKLGEEKNGAYLEKNPKLGIVEVNKTDADKLEFTPEEREKLAKVKSIKLKVVEDVTLNTLNVRKVDKKHKASILQSIDMNLSQYSIPLPLMCDYCTFKGAQTIQLIQAVQYEDATIDEVIANKAFLIYNQLCNSANFKKYDENGKVILSYSDFLNKFLYHDIDMALYGVLVASSMENVETELTCNACDSKFTLKYNMKSLLNLDDLNDNFKSLMDDILGHKSDKAYLNKLFDKRNVVTKVESPLTHNVYSISYPSVAKAINIYSIIDQKDQTMLYLSVLALFISDAYIYNSKEKDYIQIEDDEYKELLDILERIPQEEIDILRKFIDPMLYAPKFVLKSKCNKCGNEMTNDLSIDQMVFLKARDSSTEIQ